MTTNAIDIRTRQQRTSPVPNLPAIARDPLDDCRLALAAFSAKQSGTLDTRTRICARTWRAR